MSDRYLIDVDSRVFAIWDGRLIQAHLIVHFQYIYIYSFLNENGHLSKCKPPYPVLERYFKYRNAYKIHMSSKLEKSGLISV